MTKNPIYKSYNPNSRKPSYSQDTSPLHSSKTKKEPISNRYQPGELDSHLRVSSKSSTRKPDPQLLTTNVFINNLNVQINSSQNNQKRVSTPLSATISNRKNSKQYGQLTQKEELALAEYRESKSRQKSRVPSAPVTFEEALPPNMLHGTSFDPRKNPMSLIPRHNSEASNDLSKSGYMAKFKGTDPGNKFGLKTPAKVFSQPEDSAPSNKFKKPNTRAQQKSFDLNAGVPLGKYTPYQNTYSKPSSTANNSPRNNEQEKRTSKADNGSHLSNSMGPKVVKTSLERTPTSAKPGSKSPMLASKHRKTPSFDLTRRDNVPQQKTMTPPMLDRMRRSADYGNRSQTKPEPTNKNTFRFAIRTRAGVAPNGTRKINQDSFIFHANYAKKSDRYLLGVCDGHGINGHFVSGFVKEAIPIFLANDPKFETNVGQAFINSFELCHQKLQSCDFDCKFSGTTSVVLMIDGNRIISANAGDSRALMGSFSKGMGWDYTLLSEDQKPDTPQEAQRIIKSGGRIEPFRDGDGGFVGPHRVWLMHQDIPGLAMARSIGDFVAASVGVSCTPEIKEFTIGPNDKFMIIASDGVWEFIESVDVVKIIIPFYEQNNIEGACDYLLGVALKSWQEEEEVVVDDITLILVFF